MTVVCVPPLEEEPWPTLGPQVCAFIEQNLVFGPGDLRGAPAKLDADKRAMIYRAYEIFPEGHPQAARRRFNRVVLSLRKGLAKTELAAWIAGCELHPEGPVRCDGFREGQPIGRGVVDPYIPMVAYTEEQTEDLAYAALLVVLSEGPLANDFDLGLQRIMRITGDGKAVALASSPDARDGARTTFQHFDEPLAVDTPLPTPAGWTTIGAVQVGDCVFGRDGRPVRVVGKSPVHAGRPCYRVTFADASSVITDGAHRWRVIDRRVQYKGEQTVTTAGMAEEIMLRMSGRPAFRWAVPLAAALDLPAVTLPIDPYILGLWLGDGDSNNATISASRMDVEHVEMMVSARGYTATRSHTPADRAALTYVGGLRGQLRRATLFGAKRIPLPYMRASRAQRLDLLRGLMDSDGHVTRFGWCSFVTNKRAMADQVAELCRTLGLRPTMISRAEPRSTTGEMLKVAFQAHDALVPFAMTRKAIRCDRPRARRQHYRSIAAIEPVSSVPVQCIAVDSVDHLFLAGTGMIVTHNTHRFTLPRLKAAHRTMLANLPKRRASDAWALETTTAYATGEGSVAEEAMTYARAIEEGKATNPRMFFFHRQASPELDFEDPAQRRRGLVEASGGDEEWHNVDTIAAQFEDPTADHLLLERLWGNRPVAGGGRAFPAARWHELARPDYVPADRTLITLGFDGARFHDATALIGTEIETGHQFVIGIWEPPLRTAAKGPEAEEWEVPQRDVDAAVAEAFRRWNVWRMYADPYWFESWIATWQGRWSDKRVEEWRTNRPAAMCAALRAYHTAIVKGELTHDGNATFGRHIANACRQETNYRDAEGERLWLIRKERADSVFKIDAAMAGCLSWEARNEALAAGVRPSGPAAPAGYGVDDRRPEMSGARTKEF